MRKSSLFKLMLAVGLMGGVWVAYPQFGTAPSKLTTQKIADDLYVIHNDFVPGNTTALVTGEGVVLVDDKFPQDTDNILAEVKKFTNQPVKYVVNTHHHFDHSGGNANLQKMGVQVVSSAQAHGYTNDLKQPGAANIAFEDHMHIYLGGKNVELYFFGKSHTGGDVVAYFPAQRAIAMGDMFTFGDATPQLIDYSGGGSAKEWTATVSRAIALDFDTVVPGHGVVTNKAELTKFRQSTIDLRNKVHQLLADGTAKKTPPAEVRSQVEAMLRKDFHFADLHIGASLEGLMTEMR
jgi:cyclase